MVGDLSEISADPAAPVWALGLMTGTVLDGMIDMALVRTDGETIEAFGPATLAPYDETTRRLIADAVDAARQWRFEGPEPAIFATAEAALTRAQSAAVTQFLSDSRMAASEVAVVGFHGQTVLHRAPRPGCAGRTRQLGDGALMARLVGTRVAYDFRTADMRAGGQGAPLAAVYHAALMRRVGAGPETAVLNLGGVGNLTWASSEGTLAAFDTGPANAPINDWVVRHGLGDMDRDGTLARKGEPDEARVAALLEHPYFKAAYPKSLDRNDFSAAMADGLSVEDGAATLTAFVAGAVGHALDLLPRRPSRLVLCGGGRRNPTLAHEIASRAAVETVAAESLGWRGDAIEAECFAFLAVRRLRGLPISFPTTTGVPEPMTGGCVVTPSSPEPSGMESC